MKTMLLAVLIGTLLSNSTTVFGGREEINLQQLALEAVSPQERLAMPAIAALRAQGPAGLQALLAAHAEVLERHAGPSAFLTTAVPDDTWLRLKTALDAVGQQRDCYASRLFWFTDFQEAKAAAKASGKPILSLRLLGRLDEEFSCANSRFFRTTLYANTNVSRYLREHFVLHWKSVRPVPRVTIDFGDGRKVERTITGNSIHYALDPQGRVLDAVPGLYGPQAFLAWLQRVEELARQCSAGNSEMRKVVLREFHASRLAALRTEWANDLAKVSPALAGQPLPVEGNVSSATVSPPSAQVAARVAVSKTGAELPLIRAISPKSAGPILNEFEADDATWAKITAIHADIARLDESSKVLMRAKSPNALDAGRLALSKRLVEDPLLRTMRNLERSIAEDTVRNEYTLHSRIHAWFAGGLRPDDVDKINAKVYAELFLTPDSDPWLGLVPSDTYPALENDGLAQSK